VTDKQDHQHEQQKPDQTDKPRWQDPGDDDIGVRNQAPESILNKMLKREE
jgi:hypothetical protein